MLSLACVMFLVTKSDSLEVSTRNFTQAHEEVERLEKKDGPYTTHVEFFASRINLPINPVKQRTVSYYTGY